MFVEGISHDNFRVLVNLSPDRVIYMVEVIPAGQTEICTEIAWIGHPRVITVRGSLKKFAKVMTAGEALNPLFDLPPATSDAMSPGTLPIRPTGDPSEN
jgi:hypothetical protein